MNRLPGAPEGGPIIIQGHDRAILARWRALENTFKSPPKGIPSRTALASGRVRFQTQSIEGARGDRPVAASRPRASGAADRGGDPRRVPPPRPGQLRPSGARSGPRESPRGGLETAARVSRATKGPKTPLPAARDARAAPPAPGAASFPLAFRPGPRGPRAPSPDTRDPRRQHRGPRRSGPAALRRPPGRRGGLVLQDDDPSQEEGGAQEEGRGQGCGRGGRRGAGGDRGRRRRR